MTKVIVLSVDSLFEKDLEFVKNLPNFKSILENCSIVKNINCVYPTLTYPCHTSMVTGVYPKNMVYIIMKNLTQIKKIKTGTGTQRT